jgi:hypothetical protein
LAELEHCGASGWLRLEGLKGRAVASCRDPHRLGILLREVNLEEDEELRGARFEDVSQDRPLRILPADQELEPAN